MFIINKINIVVKYIVVKRFITLLSIFFSFFYSLQSQEITFSDPYTEKILFNPAYSGLSQCAEINLAYNKNFIYDYYSTSFNQFIDKYNSGFGIIISNNSQAKGAINNFKADLIYSYKIKLGKNKILNTAIQTSYIQQNINTSNLIFNDQIDPINGIISHTSGESFFQPYNTYDFTFGTSYISDTYRIGFAISHIDKIFNKSTNSIINPLYKLHIGKVFSIKNKDIHKYLKSFTPEVIYNYQTGFHQIIYGFHIINNIFLTRIFVKHNLRFNSISNVFTFGLNYKRIRLSYTYDLLLTKNITLPIGGNQVSLRYNFNCRKKRNIKNTIFCTNI